MNENDSRLKRAGVSGYNKPKRTPNHPTKSHIVVAKEGDQIKTIRFGQQGASTAGKPKKGESKKMKQKRASFKARHGKNIAKGRMSAAFWADKVKWSQEVIYDVWWNEKIWRNEKESNAKKKKNEWRS